MIENQMVVDKPSIPYSEPRFVEYTPEPVCGCGCGKTELNYVTHEGEALHSIECFVRISLQERWIVKKEDAA